LGLGFDVSGSVGFGVCILGQGLRGFGFWVLGIRCEVWGLGCRVQVGFKVKGLGFRV
jgi:hypothetical protein